jgi:DNA-binding NarL/FixJ family response regulator
MHRIAPIKVLVVHGDPIAHAGIAAAFGRYPDLEVCDSDDEVIVSIDARGGNQCVDVVVADYSSGIALAREVRRQGGTAAPRIVIVACNDREWEIRCALEMGVRGYMLTGCALDELAEGVRAAYRGARHLCPRVAARLAESMAVEALTTREEEVLRLVVAGLCNKAIGRRLNIAVGTVKSHLKASFDKLGVESRTQAVAAVERRGLLRESPSTPSFGVQPQTGVSRAAPRQAVELRQVAVAA